jgi:hypothetical protein
VLPACCPRFVGKLQNAGVEEELGVDGGRQLQLSGAMLANRKGGDIGTTLGPGGCVNWGCEEHRRVTVACNRSWPLRAIEAQLRPSIEAEFGAGAAVPLLASYGYAAVSGEDWQCELCALCSGPRAQRRRQRRAAAVAAVAAGGGGKRQRGP